MGDVFDGSGTCLLDYISHAGEMGVDDALYVTYVAKKGVNSTSDGWGCEYYPKCKVALRTENKGADNADIVRKQPRCPFSHKRTRRNESDRVFDHNQVAVEDDDTIFDMNDSDFPNGKSDSRDVGKLSGEEPDQSELTESEERGEFKMKEGDRKDMTRAASRRIETSNYVVFVSSTENHVSVI